MSTLAALRQLMAISAADAVHSEGIGIPAASEAFAHQPVLCACSHTAGGLRRGPVARRTAAASPSSTRDSDHASLPHPDRSRHPARWARCSPARTWSTPSVHGPSQPSSPRSSTSHPERAPLSPLVRHVETHSAGAAAHPQRSKTAPRCWTIPTAALDHFYAVALAHRTTASPAPSPAIVHYGDSPTTADLITGDIRAHPADSASAMPATASSCSPSPGLGISTPACRLTGSGWRSCTAHPLRRSARRHLRTRRRHLRTAAQAHRAASNTRDPGHIPLRSLVFCTQPGGGTLSRQRRRTYAARSHTSGGTSGRPASRRSKRPPGVRSLELQREGGPVRLFGITAEKTGPGVVYDTLGLNGASISVLSRMFNAAHLGRGIAPSPSRSGGHQLRHQRGRLRRLSSTTNTKRNCARPSAACAPPCPMLRFW